MYFRAWVEISNAGFLGDIEEWGRTSVATVKSRNAESGKGGESFGVMIVLKVFDGLISTLFLRCSSWMPYTSLRSVVGGS